jgi:hypothetical protein
MARYCRDREFVLAFWKLAAKDPSCPWALRVYCINNLAIAMKVVPELAPLPGIRAVNKVPEPSPVVSKELPTEVEVEASTAVDDVKNFLKQLGGANGGA